MVRLRHIFHVLRHLLRGRIACLNYELLVINTKHALEPFGVILVYVIEIGYPLTITVGILRCNEVSHCVQPFRKVTIKGHAWMLSRMGQSALMPLRSRQYR